ncbi:hypothetical protein [Nitratireductor rhodophyticola]|uniref:hypothetical protein n=1 Tax=Nitratireductor rhodophyticola TaxID=2854036 RepID=UPI003BAC1B81
MTVPSQVNRSGPYLGNGVTTVFDYEFKIDDENHLKVVKRNAAGVESELVIDDDYIVSDVGNPSGGQVAVVVAPAAGETITLLRNVPFVQETDLENQGAYYAETVENALDLAVMRDQQLQEQVSRAVRIPASADPSELDSLIADIIRLGDSATNIDTVAGSIAQVNAVGSNIGDVQTVATIAASVENVASISTEIQIAASIQNEIVDVANIAPIVPDIPGYAAAAVDAKNAAEDWATRPEDDPVPESSGGDGATTYSALHWAAKAASNAATAAGLKPYATRTEIKALNIAEETTAYLKEAGREGVFEWRFGDYSAEIAADTLEGIYLKADGVAATVGAWVRSYYGLANVKLWGAALDNTQDDTEAFNVALAVAKDVLFPEGLAYITDMIQVPNNGNLIGLGVGRSRFSIKSDFNLSAECVVKLGTSENQALIDKIGFEFFQPTSAVRADMIQYPYAVGHRNIPRARIGHIRISRGWNGIDASQNAGGATYDWIECGTLNIGLHIDGALDTMNIGRFRFWPFGMSANVNVGVVYRDGLTIAATIGKCDGLEGEIHSFRGRVEFNANGAGSAGRHLHALHLDGDGARLRVLDGVLDIDYLYCTKTSTPTDSNILLDGVGNNPAVRIANIDMRSSQTAVGILVNVGSLSINGGSIDHRALGHEAALVQSSGQLAIRNTELRALGARTVPYVRSNNASATLIVQDCNAPSNGGTGTLINLPAATADSMIGPNSYGGRSLDVAAGVAIGKIKEGYRGYSSGDATTTVRLPDGWSIIRVSAGNYSITHNLGWTLSRTLVGVFPQDAGEAVGSMDIANSTTNSIRVRTKLGGAATDLPFSFSVEHI